MKPKCQKAERNDMFLKIGAILGALWLLGMLCNYKLGGAIHLVLAGAIVMALYGLNKGWRRPA
jgi:hypothetical protein